MAAKVAAPEYLPDYPGSVSVKRLEGTLVSKRVDKVVPNHLADTKIFTKVKRNGMLQCKPAVVHFDGYKVGELHQQTLMIINASRENQPMHIIPPTTSHFSIKYSKQRSSLVPGLSLDVTVQFRPTEWCYYYDCVRVHCKDDHNLLIPIHAYPVMNTAKFPRNVTFPPTAISQTRTKSISLKCDVPIDFEFELSYLQKHPAFTVTPMKGIVSANGEIDVNVTFAPTDFSTACMKLQLELSQFNSSPLMCTFTGSSNPGLTVDQVKRDLSTTPLKTRVSRPPALLASDKKTKRTNKAKTESNTTLLSKTDEEIVRDGIVFPVNMDTPSAVSKVLAQKPGKMKASQLRQVLSTEQSSGLAPARQLKEAAFLQKVRDIANEERANQLRWVTNLGGMPISDAEKEVITQARIEESSIYKHCCNVPVPEQEFRRVTTQTMYRRTRRTVKQVPSAQPKFDTYSNDLWSRRHLALQRFVHAARKVVIQLRCQARLERLKLLLSDISAGKTIQESLANLSSKDPDIITITPLLSKTPDCISLSLFPDYKGRATENGLENTSNESLKQMGQNTVSTSHVKKEVPFVDLKVPQQYKLMGYVPQAVPAHGSYLHPGPSRPLRYGAQDELDNLGHIPGVDPAFLVLIKPPPNETTVTTPVKANKKSKKAKNGDTSAKKMKEESIIEDSIDIQNIEASSVSVEKELPLVPPQSLFRRQPTHPLHIFNPTPGVASYVPMMANSAVSFDQVLKPLPAFPTAKHPQVRLDPMDVVPEVMHWKKYPSHCLTAMEGNKKLATVWKPRWSDSFSTDLLPERANGGTEMQLLTEAQSDDYVDKESDGVLPVPTMDMVRAQFNLESPSPQKKNPRLKAKGSLEVEKKERFNQLGDKIHQKLRTFQGLLGDTKHRVDGALS